AIISSRREDFAMTMESEEFATMQRNLFEVFWASCPAQPRQYKDEAAAPGRTSGKNAGADIVEAGDAPTPGNGVRTGKAASKAVSKTVSGAASRAASSASSLSRRGGRAHRIEP